MAAVPLGLPPAMLLPCPALLPLLLGITAASQSWPRQQGIIIHLNVIHDSSQEDQSGSIQDAIIRSLRSQGVYDSTIMRNMKRSQKWK